MLPVPFSGKCGVLPSRHLDSRESALPGSGGFASCGGGASRNQPSGCGLSLGLASGALCDARCAGVLGTFLAGCEGGGGHDCGFVWVFGCRWSSNEFAKGAGCWKCGGLIFGFFFFLIIWRV